ncbi:MAG TPA: response regulator transcription factor [Anaerolineae bacterium]|nr:response regulator transcription factor [Anaerolineae bacterium]
MKILLVDDHGLFLEGLGNLLRAGGYQVVGAARDGLEALELARSSHPDVILMDIRMPRCDGLCATRLIHAEMPTIKIVILTTSTEEADLFEAIKSGASGYLLKNLETAQLFDYLVGLERGEAPLSRELSSRLLAEFAHQAAALDERTAAFLPGAPPDPELTPRQREILEMVAGGLSYKEVAAALYLSENTIKYHMGEVLQRLHLKNREQAVAYALRSGWTSGPESKLPA